MYRRIVLKSRGFSLRNPQIPKFLLPFSCFCSSSSIRTFSYDSKLGFVLKEIEDLHSLKHQEEDGAKSEDVGLSNGDGFTGASPVETKLQISHPWPEWVDLMEHLLRKGYFEGSTGHPFNGKEIGSKDANRIRTASLNFARDRIDFIRYFSRKDIHMVVGSGCPSIDRKVVNSGKRLRAHVGLEEGHVCSSCNLRGSCERAYIKARDDEGGRTVDVMRILVTYGLDHFIGSVENKLCLNKSIKESTRKLLSEMVELGNKEFGSSNVIQQNSGNISVPMKQGDWVCPRCNFLNFARNIKCLRCNGLFQDRLQKLRENQDHLPLKKGDWLCDKCNFLNFAKNTRCLQCKEKPPKRLLNPGEWECESCNYINFRKNMVCLKCDWKRPKASNNAYPTQHEDGRFHQNYRMKFVEDDAAALTPCYESSKFDDFPMKGGKSVVSQNPKLWKDETSKRVNESANSQVHDDLAFELPKKLAALKTTDDDEEMAGWFGFVKKTQTDM